MSPVVDLAATGIRAAARRAAELLAVPGTVLLLPTETVYGLVCRTDDETAVRRIYELKVQVGCHNLSV